MKLDIKVVPPEGNAIYHSLIY